MTSDAEDRSTINRDELLRRIEENGGPIGLDLRGAVFLGEGRGNEPIGNPIDLRPAELERPAKAYGQTRKFPRHPIWRAFPSNGIYLARALLQGAKLQGAKLQGASLYRAELCKVNLSHAKLQGADLRNARLQKADLWRANLEGADLEGANLKGVDLRGASLERVDMYDVDSLDGALWYGALLDHTHVKQEHLGKAIGDELLARRKKEARAYHYAKEAYLLLKNNFNQIGRYEDASRAYVKEQQMEKMEYYWEWRQYGWDAVPVFGSLARLLLWPAWKLLCGLAAPSRGEPLLPRLLRGQHNRSRAQELRWPALTSFSLWLVRSLKKVVYGLATPYRGEPLVPRLLRLRRQQSVWLAFGPYRGEPLVPRQQSAWPAFGPFRRWLRNWAYELTTGYGERPLNAVGLGGFIMAAFAFGYWVTGAVSSWIDAAVYSLATFATFNLAPLSAQPQGTGVDIASSVEALLGIAVLALVVFTLGNRMSRG